LFSNQEKLHLEGAFAFLALLCAPTKKLRMESRVIGQVVFFGNIRRKLSKQKGLRSCVFCNAKKPFLWKCMQGIKQL